MTIETVAVLGAGNAGHTAAAHLALRGYRVRLASRDPARVAAAAARGGIELTGVAGEGVGRLERATADLGEALDGAQLVMLTVAGPGLEDYARRLAPLLRPGQLVFLNPGQVGGALQLARALREHGYRDRLRLVQGNTLTYGCRVVGPARAWAYVLVQEVHAAALPAADTAAALAELAPLYPALRASPDVLHSGLHYLNCVLHAPGMVCNAGWVEHARGGFKYYYEGTTPAVARVIEAVDAERLRLLAALGLPGTTFVDAFYRAGYTTEAAWRTGSVYRAFQESEPNKPRPAPETLDHRYMNEDVPYGLAPMGELGRLASVAMPTVDAVVQVASALMGEDYRATGRTARLMGLTGLSLDAIRRRVREGPV
jgi:opine dehydrogenase